MASGVSSCDVTLSVYNKPANNLWEYCCGDWESRKRRRRSVSLSTLAQGPEPPALDPDDLRSGPSSLGPLSVEGVASPAYEVGVEWITQFSQCPANHIPCQEPQCMGFYDKMASAGCGGTVREMHQMEQQYNVYNNSFTKYQ